ncbi:MAG: hypothetical protein KJ077_09165 [Anaerolineae bacterium]|nr:hypothetical protein [Anaerolineae bacterium]
MKVNLDLEFRILFVAIAITFLVIVVGGTLQYHKNLMSKRAFLYVFIPVSVLPSSVAMTYIAWPGNTLNLVTRLLIALLVQTLVMIQVYFISFPLFKAMMPRVKEYFEDNEKMK